MPGGQQNLLFGDNFVGMHPGESAYISENEYISDAPGCIPTIGVLQKSSNVMRWGNGVWQYTLLCVLTAANNGATRCLSGTFQRAT